MEETLSRIIKKLPERVGRTIEFLPDSVTDEICEIRLRKDMPVVLTLPQKSLFLTPSGRTTEDIKEALLTVDEKDINECFINLCNHSVYARQNEIKEGYLSLDGGCRAGLGGRFFEGGITDLFSINIRIARQIKDCALSLGDYLFCGLLIAGPPCSGKTTVLRDAVRILSGRKIRVCVIDTREEITARFEPFAFADTIITKDKAKGAEIALRTMSPQVIVFDEIATSAELKSVFDMLSAGVKVITTAHIRDERELYLRPVTARLMNSGAIEYAAILPERIGGEIKIIKRKEGRIDLADY